MPVALVSVLAAGIGVTVLNGEATAAAGPGATPGLDRYYAQRPAWHRCAADQPAEYQCATITVPLDYAQPAGTTIRVAISRIKTTVPSKRRGVLLFNPGGPGGPGLNMPVYMRTELPKNVVEQYDLIGFDPRGLGESSPITCGLGAAEMGWLSPYRPQTFAKDVARTRTVAEKCAAKAGDRIAHITTRNTARDMDVIRGVLGEPRISYFGSSYGTYLGAVYAQMFSGHADRIVLDSAVDPALVWRGMVQSWSTGSKPAFARWTRWTAQRDAKYRLGATPSAVSKTFWDLVAHADRTPITYQDHQWTGDDIRMQMRAGVFTPEPAADTVADLERAASGTPPAGARPRTTPRYRFARAEPPDDNSDAVFWSVVCGDARNWPRDPEQYRRDAVRDKVRYPLFGDVTSNIMPCAFWKVRGTEPATRITTAAGVLVVQNQWDSQTPLSTGLAMHRALRGSRLVYVKGGEGHGVYGAGGNRCAYDAVNAYLATGALPPKDVTCQVTAGSKQGVAPARQPIPVRPDRF